MRKNLKHGAKTCEIRQHSASIKNILRGQVWKTFLMTFNTFSLRPIFTAHYKDPLLRTFSLSIKIHCTEDFEFGSQKFPVLGTLKVERKILCWGFPQLYSLKEKLLTDWKESSMILYKSLDLHIKISCCYYKA